MIERIKIGDAAKLLGRSIDTLRRWDESSQLPAFQRGKGSYRYYSVGKLEKFSQKLDRFKIAEKWTSSQKAFEPLLCYYCSDSFVFQSRLSRMERKLSGGKDLSDFLSLVVAVTGEIGNNSFDHNIGNWPDIPGVFFSFDLVKRNIVLADRGRGVLKTLERVKPGLVNHKEALRVAFTEVISGRLPERRGNGLKFVKSAVQETEMYLVFQTGDARLFLSGAREFEISKAKKKIRGCLAQIGF